MSSLSFNVDKSKLVAQISSMKERYANLASTSRYLSAEEIERLKRQGNYSDDPTWKNIKLIADETIDDIWISKIVGNTFGVDPNGLPTYIGVSGSDLNSKVEVSMSLTYGGEFHNVTVKK